MIRRVVAMLGLVAAALARPAAVGAAAPPRPNVILIVCDDLGYADLGCFGSQTCQTPRLDRMAREGVRLTDFTVLSPVCSASRAAFLTGAYPERVGIRGAFGPADKRGLNHAETTIAEMLRTQGYATGMAGKWHLGSRREQLPTHHGFEEFLGIPYSGDMWPSHPETPDRYPPLPLIEGDRPSKVGLTADDQRGLTRLFADRAVRFIRRHHERPFFFLLTPNQPHVPLFASPGAEGRTGRGRYADVVAEIDESVGRILDTLQELGIDDRTLVIFTSDNGPWLSYGDHAGSAGPLREGKGTCYEGGLRVPLVARWPGSIPAGTARSEPCAAIDLLPTLATLAGAPLPAQRIDGVSIAPLLRSEPGAALPPRMLAYYYEQGELQAVRSGRWKLHFPHTARTMLGQTPGHGGMPGKYRPLPVGSELYDLDADLGESRNLAADRPEVVRDLQAQAQVIRHQLGDKLTQTPTTAVRPVGSEDDR